MTDRLRQLWDFDDLDGTEERLRDRLAGEHGSGRAEVLTQLARIQGLRGDFEAGERLIKDAEATAGTSQVTRASKRGSPSRFSSKTTWHSPATPIAQPAYVSSPAKPELTSRLYNGIFPCFRLGLGSRLVNAVSSA